MEVDRSVDGFSPKLDWCLRVYHHSPCLLSDRPDHSLRDAVLVVRVWRAGFVCCTTGSEH